jgi:hypothetical protein
MVPNGFVRARPHGPVQRARCKHFILTGWMRQRQETQYRGGESVSEHRVYRDLVQSAFPLFSKFPPMLEAGHPVGVGLCGTRIRTPVVLSGQIS